MSNKFGIQFDGFVELMEKLDALGGDLKEAATDALEAAHNIVTPQLTPDMAKHRRTGITQKSIVDKPVVEWEGQSASISVGFKITNGGLPSIFLMYGTPRMAKDRKLYNDIYGAAVKKKIATEQEKIIQKAIQKRLGG